jgi:hypothetical protein
MKIRVTMYFKPFKGMSEKEARMEGGPVDQKKKPLQSLEEFIDGTVSWVSLSRDDLGGPPGSDPRFQVYGTKVRIPEVEQLMGRDLIEFRLVDTGGHFRGKGKVVKVQGAEPIDLCRSKPLRLPRTEGLMTLEFIE